MFMCYPVGHNIVPRLYFVPECEFTDEALLSGSVATMKDSLNLPMEPLMEEVPFQWSQALYFTTRLTSKATDI